MSAHREHWTLDPDVAFLNHGSFGACPRPVLERQAELRARIERQPVRFFQRDLEGLLDEARATLAEFVGARPENLAFVPNATTGVNAVLRSLPLAPGDRLLVTDHEYPASKNALDFVAERAGVVIDVATLPYPLEDPSEVTRTLANAVRPETRLLLVDHVTSQTGMVLPLAEIAREMGSRDVEVLVDGAHGPGMLDLSVAALGVTYYTGNCHKWLCAPKGAAFLWVSPARLDGVRPTVISHGASADRSDRSRFLAEFDWPGTDDPTAYLCVPDALRFLGGLLPGGWSELRASNRSLALYARERLSDALGQPPPCPASMIGSLVGFPLGPVPSASSSALASDSLQDRLLADAGIEVPVFPWPAYPARQLRISAQIYNERAEYDRLASWLTSSR